LLVVQQLEKYKRHRPETTLLYQLVERYYPEFTANLAEQGKYLPKYIEREFDEFLHCGRLEYGFYAWYVVIASTRSWLHLAASDEDFAPVVGPEEWQKVQHCW
jgi:hypothetical protein